jgi:hypothetical protein
MSIDVVPSKCWIVTSVTTLAWTLRTVSSWTVRCVDAAGEPTTVVVVAVVTSVLVRPGVTVPAALSAHVAWMSTVAAALVTIRRMSLVEARMSIRV